MLLLILAQLYSWTTFQLDVETAYLYGDLQETVFMYPPRNGLPFTTGDNVADIFTKAFPTPAFSKHRSTLQVHVPTVHSA